MVDIVDFLLGEDRALGAFENIRKSQRTGDILDIESKLKEGKSPDVLGQLSIYDPERAASIQKQQQATLEDELRFTSNASKAILRLPPENRPQAYRQVVRMAEKRGIDVADLPTEYSQEVEQQLQLMSQFSGEDEISRLKLAIEEKSLGLRAGELEARLSEQEQRKKLLEDYGRPSEVQVDKFTSKQDELKYIDNELIRQGKLAIDPSLAKSAEVSIDLLKERRENLKESIDNERKAKLSLVSNIDEQSNLLDKINKSIGQINSFSSGLLGQSLQDIGSTDAADLAANLETIKANLGFGALKELRKQGGTLGQVTERELAFLQSTKQNLNQKQSPEQLRDNLISLKEDVQSSLARIGDAFKEEYGYIPEGFTDQLSDQLSEQSKFEGKTAINPNTGERLIYKGGKWQPL